MRSKWVLQSCHSGVLSCENDEKASTEITEVLNILEKKFKIEYDGNGALGLDGIYSDYQIEGKIVTVGWDCWSGVFIMSRSIEDNSLIEEIAKYLSENAE